MVHFELQSQYDIVCVSITVDKKCADVSRGELLCCQSVIWPSFLSLFYSLTRCNGCRQFPYKSWRLLKKATFPSRKEATFNAAFKVFFFLYAFFFPLPWSVRTEAARSQRCGTGACCWNEFGMEQWKEPRGLISHKYPTCSAIHQGSGQFFSDIFNLLYH